MAFLEARVTFGKIENCDSSKSLHIIRKALPPICPEDRWIWGIEDTDKKGQTIAEHIHFRVHYKELELPPKDTIQSRFRRISKELGCPFNGRAGHYAVMVNEEVKDIDRWLRYPLKCPKEYGHSKNVKEFVEKQLPLAQEERRIQIEQLNKKIDRVLNKDSFKNKMYNHFENDLKIRDERTFLVTLIKYYMDKGKVAPLSKLKDYWFDYQLTTKMMTPEEWLDINYYQN